MYYILGQARDIHSSSLHDAYKYKNNMKIS